ncbi:hypothetical protein [Parachryseolinea silvisoli]|uniref:hypothetical protein n=1 Tax=Parachryseolinea silvisoli TaxID=2873601 RepID=UPI002265C37D|nr:hypothetical protein [Parachryseolinea silvisoli]MCD9019302.1 hypothetical protein [Parachryseolinea silvisoli]
MKTHIVFFLLVLFAACQQQGQKEITFANMPPAQKVNYDTTKFTEGQVYQRDTINHPLRQFYLAYSEWEKISCIVAVDETGYWDKSMIGLIETSGKLRVHYNQQKIYLPPVNNVKMKEGEYKNVFKNDTLEIQLSTHLEPKTILRCLTGNGTLTVKVGSQTIEESVFLVYEIEE